MLRDPSCDTLAATGIVLTTDGGCLAARWSLRVGTLLVVLLGLCLLGWVGLDLAQSRERDLLVVEQTGATLTRLLDSHLQATAGKIDQQMRVFAQRFQGGLDGAASPGRGRNGDEALSP